MHFYLDLLLIKLAYYVEFISCFCFSAWSKQVCYELTVEFSCNSMSTTITPASNLGYLAPPQDNFSWVPNCSLGPPGWETKVSSKKNLVWAM